MKLFLFQIAEFVYYHGFLNLLKWSLSLSSHTKIRTSKFDVTLRSRSFTDVKVLNYTFNDLSILPLYVQPSVILDLGSNIGLTALKYKTIFPDVKIIAVEMDKSNFDLLCKNLIDFKDVTLFNNSISSFSGDRFYFNTDFDSYKLVDVNERKDENCIQTISMTIDSVLEKSGISNIDFLKIDIEGAEIELFRNCSAWIDRIFEISCEVHSKSHMVEIKNTLEANNFLVFNMYYHHKRIHAISKTYFNKNNI